MTAKSKKSKSAGRFGARYGKRTRAKVVNVEKKQRLKQKCLFCGKLGAKRISNGIWQCTRKTCGKKFASNTYLVEGKTK